MFYKSRKLNIIRNRVMTIIKIVIATVFDIIKLIFLPLKAASYVGKRIFYSLTRRRRVKYTSINLRRKTDIDSHYERMANKYPSKRDINECYLSIEDIWKKLADIKNDIVDIKLFTGMSTFQPTEEQIEAEMRHLAGVDNDDSDFEVVK